MKHRLSEILKNCENTKYRKGFIKYLGSLNYKEFKELYIHYTVIVIKYENKFKSESPRFFSKNWFITKYTKIKSDKVFHIFIQSNRTFFDRVGKELNANNKLRETLMNDMNDVKNKIDILSKFSFEIQEKPSSEDIIMFSSLLIQNVYLKNKLEKLTSDIENLDSII